jgi:hypothetical protein
MVKKDVVVSEEIYWSLVELKNEGQYRSIDEALRPVLGIVPGARPHLEGFDENASCASAT